MSRPIITIGIPVYNSERTIAESIESALLQNTRKNLCEVLVIDDGSTDRTAEIARKYPVRLILNHENRGIGKTLQRIMKEAWGHYVMFLCGDDQFTHPMVAADVVNQFWASNKIGIVGRYYYQYMDGHPGAIMTCRERSILISSCNPSGMAFKRREIIGTNKIFIECPSIVVEYLLNGFEWTMLEYDTIRARIHPGGNTGTKESYYNGSMYENWRDLLGVPLKFYPGYIQIKNRAPKKLMEEICQSLKGNGMAFWDPIFWLYAIVAGVVPGSVLKPLSNFYRHRITRMFCRIKERKIDERLGKN